MNFKPKNDDELNTFDLFPAGEYDFEVVKAVDDTSKSGNEMIKLEIDVYAISGKKTRVYDYLLESMDYKLKHFCEATGLLREYEAGDLTADMCKNRSGRCKLIIRVDAKGVYPEQNVIKDYCKQSIASSHKPKDGLQDSLDDISEESIPF